jgi:hypothetical protein
MIADDLDIPPLEDMSHVIERKPVLSKPILKQTQLDTVPVQAAPKAPKKEFQGLKKGFFSQPKVKNPSKNVKKEEIPYIKANQTKNPLEFDQVRDAMASKLDQSRKDWMTPSFISKIEKSPVLKKAFEDDRFLEMSRRLVQDPVTTLQECQRDSPHWMLALREFSGLLGEAFEEKANVDTTGLDSFEKGLVDRVMNDSKLQDALKDLQIQKLLMDLKTNQNPYYLSQILGSCSTDMKQKIQLLIQSGLVSVQQ